MFQDAQLLPALTALENVKIALELAGLTPAEGRTGARRPGWPRGSAPQTSLNIRSALAVGAPLLVVPYLFFWRSGSIREFRVFATSLRCQGWSTRALRQIWTRQSVTVAAAATITCVLCAATIFISVAALDQATELVISWSHSMIFVVIMACGIALTPVQKTTRN